MNKQFFKLLEGIDPNKFDMVYSSPNGMTVLRSSEYDFRLEQIHELKRENIKLQQKIDKAIEYIEHYKPVALEDKILKILEGGNNY